MFTALTDIEQVVGLLWPFMSGPKRQQIEEAFDTRAANMRCEPALPNPGQKVTDAQVNEILALLASGRYKQAEIGAMYGISQAQVSTIKLGRRKTLPTRARVGRKPTNLVEWPVTSADPRLEQPEFLDLEAAAAVSTLPGERAWAAGFFDAEGCSTARLGRYLGLGITQTNTETLERFKAAMGGLGQILSRGERGQPSHWKPRWQYQLSSFNGWVQAVSVLWPFLCEPKRRQIADNYAKRAAFRGTWPAEFKLPQQRLSDDQVREIRHLLAEGRLTQAEIGRRFGVSQIYVSNIKRGQRRTNVSLDG
jgi:transcriptional regulator with XRE-family HTH domain